MKLSLLDLSLILPGQNRETALKTTIEIAVFIESLEYHRIWLGEHHSSNYIAGRAPEILIAAVAQHTSKIRIGSEAVLLSHYSPYKVAEVFCTLSELHPGRIDLGVGRASSGPVTDFALQQERRKKVKLDSTQQVHELCAWLNSDFEEHHPFSRHPIDTIDPLPELHILGTNRWSALLAAELGLRYVYAGFLNQSSTKEVFQVYRDNFRPSSNKTGIAAPEIVLATPYILRRQRDRSKADVSTGYCTGPASGTRRS